MEPMRGTSSTDFSKSFRDLGLRHGSYDSDFPLPFRSTYLRSALQVDAEGSKKEAGHFSAVLFVYLEGDII